MDPSNNELLQALLEPLNALNAKLDARFSGIDSRLSDIDRQQGGLWETSVRQSVKSQFGHSFSKEFAVVSLQHLAKLVCRSTGWPYGSDAVDICRVSEKLARRLLTERAAEGLLRGVFEALVGSTGDTDEFSEVGSQIEADPWFDEAGNLDTSALGRSLSAFVGEDRKHIKSKLQKLHRVVAEKDDTGRSCGVTEICSCLTSSSVCAGRVAHLLTCRSAGVMMALYAAEPEKYASLPTSTSFKSLTQKLPYLQLQLDVRGKVIMIDRKVTIEVGEIKRNLNQYKEAKHQLVQRAKLLQWAMNAVVEQSLDFVLIGHLFTPRGKPDDNLLDNEITDDVSIFTHQCKCYYNHPLESFHNLSYETGQFN